jgi:hypothetical protein
VKRRGKSAQSVSAGSLKVDEVQESLHFRLCHVCLQLNESSSEIDKCHRCHTSFKADLHENEEMELDGTVLQVEDLDEGDLEEEIGLSYSAFRRKSPRLAGLTVLW